MSTQNQCQAILAYLQAGHSLTHLQAESLFRCARLAARINDLRKTPEGAQIQREMISVPSGKKVARYWLPIAKGQIDLFGSPSRIAASTAPTAGFPPALDHSARF